MTPVAFLWFNAILLAAAVTDLRERRIPNGLSLLQAAAALALAFPYTWADTGSHLASAGVVGVVGLTLYTFRLMGGGDLKLLAACALWMPFPSLAGFAILLGWSGALQGLATLLWVRLAPRAAPVLAPRAWREMPYAVAIGLAGLVWSAGRLISS